MYDPLKLIDARIRLKEEERNKVQEELNQLLEFSRRVTCKDLLIMIDPFEVILTKGSKELKREPDVLVAYSSRNPLSLTAASSYEHKISVLEGLVGSKIKSIIPAQANVPQAPMVAVTSYVCLATLISFVREDFVNVIGGSTIN